MLQADRGHTLRAVSRALSGEFVQVRCLAVVLAAFSALPTSARAEADLGRDHWKHQIAQAAEHELQASGTPSLQIAVGLQGEIAFSEAYGLADMEHHVKATPETRYRTASVAKWFTATATLLLADQHRLDLDQNIRTYCPHFPEKRWPITTRQLLTHTSGIRHYVDYEAQLAEAEAESERQRLELRRLQDQLAMHTRYTDVIAPLESFKDDALVYQPGTDWLYSSHGYRLLACVLEGAAGMPYRELMRKSVFEPAGMSSTVEDDAWAILQGRASGYRLESEGEIRRADMRDVSENLPAGGYLSTASDLVKFTQALGDGTLLSDEVLALMMSYSAADAAGERSWRDAIPSREKYGYGVMFFPGPGGTWVGHTGRQAGGSAIVVIGPGQDVSIAVMTNAKGWNGYMSFTEKVLGIVRGSTLP